jgi:hypothetical protein
MTDDELTNIAVYGRQEVSSRETPEGFEVAGDEQSLYYSKGRT